MTINTNSYDLMRFIDKDIWAMEKVVEKLSGKEMTEALPTYHILLENTKLLSLYNDTKEDEKIMSYVYKLYIQMKEEYAQFIKSNCIKGSL